MIIIIAAALVVVEPGRVDPSRSVKSDASSCASSNSDAPRGRGEVFLRRPAVISDVIKRHVAIVVAITRVTQLRFGVLLCRRLQSGTVTSRHVPEVSL
ncbi:hypothetical protein MTO96_004557 [Rhipicephalus appendiculatus]